MKLTEKHIELQKAILKVVDKQLKTNHPKETRETLQRLMAEGYTEKQAMDLIGHVVASEIISVIADGKRYDEIRYITALHALPELPWPRQ